MPAVFSRHEIGSSPVWMDALFFPLARFARLTPCFLLLALLWLALPTAPGRAAAGQPVTIKELCLMLRGGYTGDEVLRETAGRPLLEPLDADAEAALRQSGADAHLLDALRKTRRTLSDDEAAAARQRQAEIDERNLQSQEANRANLLAFHQQAAENHQNALRQAALDKIAGQLHGQLVVCPDGQMRPYDDEALGGKKLFAFYYSALWCAPCRKFTPQLVEFYKKFAPAHPAFELVFVSEDHSPYDMENYMRQDAMPWPALAFDAKARLPGLAALGKDGIPRLVLIDGSGRVLSDSYVDGKYVGPQHVLDDLTRFAAVAAGGNPAPVAPGAQ